MLRDTTHSLLTGRVTLIAFLMLFSFSASAQVSSKDQNDISALMQGLVDHSARPATTLDPNLSGQQRDQNLEYFTDPGYELVLQPIGQLSMTGSDSATLPIHVHFKSANKEVDAKGTLNLVRRSGQWYFADFQFVAFPTIIIVVIVIAGLVGIAYAAGVLYIRSRLVRAGKLDGGNLAKLFIPFFWPSLLR